MRLLLDVVSSKFKRKNEKNGEPQEFLNNLLVDLKLTYGELE